VFIIGTLTEVEEHEENDQYVKGELRDPTGRYMIDAGQYQDKARAHMRRIDAPEYVAVTGKATSFEGERGRVTKVRVELITEVPAGLYDHWVAEAAAQTGKRLEQYGDEDNEAAAKAEENYGSDLNKYHQASMEAVRSNKEDIEQDGTVQSDTEGQNTEEATAESPSD
jgi:hypothetical protein